MKRAISLLLTCLTVVSSGTAAPMEDIIGRPIVIVDAQVTEPIDDTDDRKRYLIYSMVLILFYIIFQNSNFYGFQLLCLYFSIIFLLLSIKKGIIKSIAVWILHIISNPIIAGIIWIIIAFISCTNWDKFIRHTV